MFVLVIHIYIYISSGNSQWKMDKRGPFSDDLHSKLVILNSYVVLLIYHRWNMFGISKDYLPNFLELYCYWDLYHFGIDWHTL